MESQKEEAHSSIGFIRTPYGADTQIQTESEEPKSKRRALCLVRMAGWRRVTANTSKLDKPEEAKRISYQRSDEINMLGSEERS